MTDANRLAARQAALTRHRGAADPATVEAARELAAAKLAAAIKATADAAPQLTPEQLCRRICRAPITIGQSIARLIRPPAWVHVRCVPAVARIYQGQTT